MPKLLFLIAIHQCGQDTESKLAGVYSMDGDLVKRDQSEATLVWNPYPQMRREFCTAAVLVLDGSLQSKAHHVKS